MVTVLQAEETCTCLNCTTWHWQHEASLAFGACGTGEVVQENTFVKMLSNSTKKETKKKKWVFHNIFCPIIRA